MDFKNLTKTVNKIVHSKKSADDRIDELEKLGTDSLDDPNLEFNEDLIITASEVVDFDEQEMNSAYGDPAAMQQLRNEIDEAENGEHSYWDEDAGDWADDDTVKAVANALIDEAKANAAS